MDLSKIRETAHAHLLHIQTCDSLARLIKVFEAGPGDRHFKLILDHDVYKDSGLEEIIDRVEHAIEENHIGSVKYMSFVPHVHIDDLQKQFEDIEFVPRSKFFKDLHKYLAWE